jgi:hypothetical protein
MDSATSFLPILFVVIVIAAVAAVIVLLVIYTKKKAAERTRAMQQAAQQLGWTFTADAPLSMIAGLERHHLFSQGHSKKLFNMMYGTIDGGRASIFDYRFTIGYGKNQQTFTQSVVYFQSERLSLPSFSLRPEGFAQKLFSAFGYQDIDFGNRPTFSSKYLLRGPDEQAIRNTFNDTVLAYYEHNLKLYTDGDAGEIFFYRQGVRVEPHDVRALLDWGLNMLGLFQRRWQ